MRDQSSPKHDFKRKVWNLWELWNLTCQICFNMELLLRWSHYSLETQHTDWLLATGPLKLTVFPCGFVFQCPCTPLFYYFLLHLLVPRCGNPPIETPTQMSKICNFSAKRLASVKVMGFIEINFCRQSRGKDRLTRMWWLSCEALLGKSSNSLAPFHS